MDPNHTQGKVIKQGNKHHKITLKSDTALDRKLYGPLIYEYHTKILNKILARRIWQHFKKQKVII